MIPFDKINSTALANLPALLAEWLPHGRVYGSEYVVGSLAGEQGESLSINIRTGKWADFASDAKGGDPISLVAAIRYRGDRLAAARDLGKRLGVYINGYGAEPQSPIAPAAPKKPAPAWMAMLPPPADAPAPDLSGFDYVHTYRSGNGTPLFYIRRREARNGGRKQFVPLTYGLLDGVTGWHPRHPTAPRPLYGLDRLVPDRPVLICEGEKAADAAAAMFPDHACLSWPGGSSAGAVTAADWSILANHTVIIWPDNDAPGYKAAADIVQRLPSGVILDVSDAPEKSDAADLRVDDPASWLAARLCKDGPERPPEILGAGSPSTPPRQRGGLDPVQIRAGEINLVAPREARPVIKVVAGELDLNATRAEEAIQHAGVPVFQRGPALVRPVIQEVPASRGRMTVAAGFREVTDPAMVDVLAQVAHWTRYDGRRKEEVTIDPPSRIARIILNREGRWFLPSVSGIVTTPTLRPDGSILHEPGYDSATRLYHVPDCGPLLPTIPRDPTQGAARGALDRLNGLLKHFPFAGDVDRAVALSGLLTPVIRGALSVAPLHAFRAPTAGTGKSFLADLASAISTGRPCPVIAAADSEAETEKRLVGLLLAGFPLLSIDNVNGELGGDLLCQAVERTLIRIRPLGRSEIVEVESRATMFATGNALRVRGDMTRRTLVANLDAGVERPELRTFPFDPVERVLIDRGRYVADALTIVRAYIVAGLPGRLSPVASFGEWSDLVRSALVWLGCADPAASMEQAREDDPELAELREVLVLWRDGFGLGESFTARDIAAKASEHRPTQIGEPTDLSHPDLRDALLRIAGERGAINTKRLGRWLLNREGRIACEMKIVKAGTAQGGLIRWAVRAA